MCKIIFQTSLNSLYTGDKRGFVFSKVSKSGKIHPIKSTLNLAISYIVNGEKTDEQILVSTNKCHQKTAHTQFLRTRNDAGTNETVLARHLIQSFLPGEASPEMVHQIGFELCGRVRICLIYPHR